MGARFAYEMARILLSFVEDFPLRELYSNGDHLKGGLCAVVSIVQTYGISDDDQLGEWSFALQWLCGGNIYLRCCCKRSASTIVRCLLTSIQQMGNHPSQIAVSSPRLHSTMRVSMRWRHVST